MRSSFKKTKLELELLTDIYMELVEEYVILFIDMEKLIINM